MISFFKLFDYLRRHNIQQKKLIDDGIVSAGTLQRMRNNLPTGSDTLSKICQYLGCRLEDIAEYEPDNSGKE